MLLMEVFLASPVKILGDDVDGEQMKLLQQ